MVSDNHARSWEWYGANEPYYGVFTNDRFLSANLSAESRAEFFESGRLHVQWLARTIRRDLAHEFSPRRILDFGCGVGRLLIPFAESADEVVGVDVSPSMLKEAASNCANLPVKLLTMIEFEELSDAFDLVNSYIVLQHIPLNQGERILRRLVELTGEGGICALHVTYRQSRGIRRVANRFREKIPGFNWMANLVSGRRLRLPMMRASEYCLSRVFELASSYTNDIHVRLTNHNGLLGAILIFRKERAESRFP